MLEIIHAEYEKLHRLGGKPSKKLRVEDRLLLTLEYLREYRTLEHLAHEYNTVVSHVHGAIIWVENILIQHENFRLPGKKVLLEGEQKPRAVAIDVTESPVERPQRKQKKLFWQEKASYYKDAGGDRLGYAHRSFYCSSTGQCSRFHSLQRQHGQCYQS